MKAGLLVALLLSAVLLIGGCAQEKEAGTPEESREGATEETTAEPTTAERTIIKETTVVVPAPAPSPAQALSPSPESQQAAGPESVAPEVEIPPEVEVPMEIDIPHDGTVVPCFQDPVCSSEQSRIQSEHVAELEAAKTDGLPPSQGLLDMCTHAVRSKTGLPKACWSVGG
jgi:hypothetical protein